MADRTILHCDLNSYFASVELLSYPELRERPVAVCGDPESRHGIILAKNEPAKKMGVQTAETLWQARRKCPGLILLPAHRERYQFFYEKINRIYLDYTDQVEAFSIDESWLDVTGSRRLFGDGPAIAQTLRRRVREETGLTLSIGVSFNKTFAKLGSDYQKPDAVTVITRGNFPQLLYPLPVGRMLFIGPTAERLLVSRGIATLGDLARCPAAALCAILGKSGESLWQWANGRDESPVRRWGEGEPVKSVGNGLTFPHDLRGLAEWKQGLIPLCEQVGERLRRQGLRCQTLALQIKDPSLKVISRQMKMSPPTALTRELFRGGLALLKASWPSDAPVRMLTVTASNLVDEAAPVYQQLDLLAPAPCQDSRQQQLEKAIDQVRSRYGREAVRLTAVLGREGPKAPTP